VYKELSKSYSELNPGAEIQKGGGSITMGKSQENDFTTLWGLKDYV
jgi:hypothetical protein